MNPNDPVDVRISKINFETEGLYILEQWWICIRDEPSQKIQYTITYSLNKMNYSKNEMEAEWSEVFRECLAIRICIKVCFL